ncbi:MAG: NAD-dependent epimerase/dehydratase family protein [Deinococcota bacterium]
MNTNHVIFGTGPVGRAIMNELVNRGENVRMINRSGHMELNKAQQERVTVNKANAYDVDAVRDVVHGAEVVYQAAQPSYSQWPEKFPPLQEAILEGTAVAGAKLVLADNLYMYGEVDGKIHEELPYAATTRKGMTRAQLAQTALDAHHEGKLQVTIGRASDFYGPYVRSSTLGERVFEPLLAGKTASVPGNPDLLHSYTFIDDFGKALVMLGTHESAYGQVWHVPNAPTRTTRDVIELAAAHLGKPAKLSGMGTFMMRVGGLFVPEARETVEMMYEFNKPFIVDSSKFVDAFGDISTSTEDGLRQTLAWYEQQLAVAA